MFVGLEKLMHGLAVVNIFSNDQCTLYVVIKWRNWFEEFEVESACRCHSSNFSLQKMHKDYGVNLVSTDNRWRFH